MHKCTNAQFDSSVNTNFLTSSVFLCAASFLDNCCDIYVFASFPDCSRTSLQTFVLWGSKYRPALVIISVLSMFNFND